MDIYSIALVIFGFVFSGIYWNYSNILGKTITITIGLFHLMQLAYSEFDIKDSIPYFNIIYIITYIIGNLLVIYYALSKKSLLTTKKIAIVLFSSTILLTVCFSLIESLEEFKIIAYLPLIVFGYIFYKKEEFEGELSFLNLIFVQSLMSLLILLNSSY